MGKLVVHALELGALGTNCYIVADPESMKAVVIDPADAGAAIWTVCKNMGWSPEKILITHGHYDHIGGLNEFRKLSAAQVFVHDLDREMLENADGNLSSLFGISYTCKGPFQSLEHGMWIDIGERYLKVIHTPGHTPGGVSFLGEDFVIVGDTLFQGSVGRTDFPGASWDQLIQSIRNQLLVLDPKTRVYPGHGPDTTLRHEKDGNPFLAGDQSTI